MPVLLHLFGCTIFGSKIAFYLKSSVSYIYVCRRREPHKDTTRRKAAYSGI